MRWSVSLRSGSSIAILSTPFEALRGEFVRRQRARAWSEGASDNDGLLPVPRLIVGHDLRVRDDILRRQLRELGRLSVQPTEWL